MMSLVQECINAINAAKENLDTIVKHVNCTKNISPEELDRLKEFSEKVAEMTKQFSNGMRYVVLRELKEFIKERNMNRQTLIDLLRCEDDQPEKEEKVESKKEEKAESKKEEVEVETKKEEKSSKRKRVHSSSDEEYTDTEDVKNPIVSGQKKKRKGKPPAVRPFVEQSYGTDAWPFTSSGIDNYDVEEAISFVKKIWPFTKYKPGFLDVIKTIFGGQRNKFQLQSEMSYEELVCFYCWELIKLGIVVGRDPNVEDGKSRFVQIYNDLDLSKYKSKFQRITITTDGLKEGCEKKVKNWTEELHNVTDSEQLKDIIKGLTSLLD